MRDRGNSLFPIPSESPSFVSLLMLKVAQKLGKMADCYTGELVLEAKFCVWG